MDKLLKIIEKNPRLTNAEIAVILGVSEQDVFDKIKLYEETGVIKGYRAIIDKNKTDTHSVTAIIEIKVHPKFSRGFEEIAERISRFTEVESVYLMSGTYDICCIVEDRSFEEVALFIANRLSPLEDVLSTSTNFVLKKYKQQGVNFCNISNDDRRTISL